MPRRFALAFALPLALAAAAMAAPPTDSQIDTLIKSIDQAKAPEGADAAAKRQARRDAATETMRNVSIDAATLPQLQKLIDKRAATASPELNEAVDTRLENLAKDGGMDGAKAADLRLQVVPTPEKPSRETTKARQEHIADLADAALAHPGTPSLFKSGGGENIFRGIASLSTDPDILKKHHFFEAITPYVTSDLSPAIVSSLSRLAAPLVDARKDLGDSKFEALRSSLAAAADAAISKAIKDRDEHAAKAAMEKPSAAADPDDKEAMAKAKIAETAKAADESMVTRMKDTKALLDGPWARGTLVNHAAPAITFLWSNTEKPIHSFADLKGKVVLVDFWATWCGPCRAAFPKMRDLQTRYSGYPVVILGITSPQGFSMDFSADKKKANRIDCKGDPAKEMGLMKAFMRDQEMTWNVAFSEQNVFNPDFGIRGIPSVAIIGPDGNVRFAGLYPNPTEESEHIDGLLKEAKLPYPETRYVEPKKADKKDEEKDEEKKS